MFALYSFKKLEFFEQVGKIHYFRAGSIKRAGRNFEQNSIIEQVLIRASRLENDQNFLVRACSLNRHTRVFKKWESIDNLLGVLACFSGFLQISIGKFCVWLHKSFGRREMSHFLCFPSLQIHWTAPSFKDFAGIVF